MWAAQRAAHESKDLRLLLHLFFANQSQSNGGLHFRLSAYTTNFQDATRELVA
jgi:hypothetical protein